MMEGKGKVTRKDCTYFGEFELNHWHGLGVATYLDGTVYKGNWVRSKKHGQGKQISATGEVLEGEWKEGVFVDVATSSNA